MNGKLSPTEFKTMFASYFLGNIIINFEAIYTIIIQGVTIVVVIFLQKLTTFIWENYFKRVLLKIKIFQNAKSDSKKQSTK